MGKKGERPRVVLDTSILISALGWKGAPHKIVDKGIENEFEWFISSKAYEELIRVLAYSKFDFISEEEKRDFVEVVELTAIFTEPIKSIHVIKDDPMDNVFLDLASEINAHYLVSGNKHLLELKKFEGTQILSALEFLQTL